MTLSPQKLEEMTSADINKLKKNNNKDDLCSYIVLLRGKLEELESYNLISKRVEMLERSMVSSTQYQRRENIEIHGVPESVTDDELEGTCLDLLNEIGCGIISPSQVHACHRLKNKSNTITRFVNRKHADKALHNRAKLKDIDKQKLKVGNANIYINENLCRPMQYLHYKIRQAHKLKQIFSYNVWKGKLSIKMLEDSPETKIAHIDDLIDIGLASEEDKIKFLA